MIKRYYKSCISMRMAVPLLISAVLVFIFAYLTFSRDNQTFYVCGVVCGIVLIALMAYSEFRKYQIGRQVSIVKNREQYMDEGAMLGKSFFLEDRMLICSEKLQVKEYPVTGLTKFNCTAVKKKYRIELDSVSFMTDNKIQAQRLAAFLKRKNPDMTITGITPDGTGTFKELMK